MGRTNLTEQDEGKTVVNANGDTIGMVSGFCGGRAYVDPDPGVTDRILSTLGWKDADDGDYVLQSDYVEAISDDAVHLSSHL